MDIVEWLRQDAEKARQNWPDVFCVSEDLAERAADEIERLRDALRAIETISDCHENARQIARAALGWEK